VPLAVAFAWKSPPLSEIDALASPPSVADAFWSIPYQLNADAVAYVPVALAFALMSIVPACAMLAEASPPPCAVAYCAMACVL
jgi:hypothetical protein